MQLERWKIIYHLEGEKDSNKTTPKHKWKEDLRNKVVNMEVSLKKVRGEEDTTYVTKAENYIIVRNYWR